MLHVTSTEAVDTFHSVVMFCVLKLCCQQVIDTVFLFHFKRQRKLSLRFLASYLLKEDIQQQTHDSIEDARTAVKLYQASHS